MSKKISKFRQIFDPKVFFYDFFKWTTAIFAAIDLRFKTIFIDKKTGKKIFNGRYLISCNHSSFEDPVILSATFWRRRVFFVSTSELFNTKFKNFFFRAIGCIEVNKKNVSMKTFKDVCNTMDRGHIVAVFPEGTVDVNSKEHETFKSGIVMMALMSKSDIIPTYILRRKNRFKRQVVYVGEKIVVKDFIKNQIPTFDDICNLTNYIKEKETELSNIAKSKSKGE